LVIKKESYYNKLLNNNKTIFIVSILVWLPVLFVPFLNDDYQILSYHYHLGLKEILLPFVRPDVSFFYWRPLGNILHPLILLTAGFNPVAFRLVSIVLYSTCCYFVAIAIKKTGIKKEYAILAAILFAILPAHDYQVAWIAEQGESLVTIFLLLTFIYYDRNKIIALLFFTAALLTKESSFTGIFIPLLFIFIDDKKKKNKIIYIRDSIIAFAVIVLLQVYRHFFIGGSPFSSNHFQDTSPSKLVFNFIISIPLSFVSPEVLDSTWFLKNKIAIIVTVIAAIVFIWYFILFLKQIHESKRKIIYLGIFWFIIFIIPALPKMMRWYVFTASLGFTFIFAVLAEQFKKEKILVGLFSLLFFILLYNDISRTITWIASGKKMDRIVNSLKQYKGNTDFVLWCVPEKYKNIPMMKLGVSQTIGYAVNNLVADADTPLRCEIFSDNSYVNYEKLNDSTMVFTLYNGRFKSLEGRSSSEVKAEYFSFSENDYRIEINNRINGTENSEAKILMPGKREKKLNLYFNGTDFVEINL
jgi:hypothetical protein